MPWTAPVSRDWEKAMGTRRRMKAKTANVFLVNGTSFPCVGIWCLMKAGS
jgi:hypothetical protein